MLFRADLKKRTSSARYHGVLVHSGLDLIDTVSVVDWVHHRTIVLLGSVWLMYLVEFEDPGTCTSSGGS